MIQWDGHTHTELCRHGSGDLCRDMIQKAIALGFTKYSITEHAPLPLGLLQDEELRRECALDWEQLPEYFSLVNQMKKEFAGRISIQAGLEIDYLPEHLDFTKNLLKEVQGQIDEWILSLHFMPGLGGGLVCVDYSAERFAKELISYYGNVDEVHRAYWNRFYSMIATDFGPSPPARVGHPGLIAKFQRVHKSESSDFETPDFFEPLFRLVAEKGYGMDGNVGGFSKKECQQFYLTKPMLHWVKKLQIPVIYGSDAHSVHAVGAHYSRFIDLLQ